MPLTLLGLLYLTNLLTHYAKGTQLQKLLTFLYLRNVEKEHLILTSLLLLLIKKRLKSVYSYKQGLILFVLINFLSQYYSLLLIFMYLVFHCAWYISVHLRCRLKPKKKYVDFLPLSLAATNGISFLLYSYSYLDVSLHYV